ncbi:hypothetical protein [Methanobrevibacter sp.]|uniref:hypothetical protein n=1 Tax=Methanobrevibacter sp. TaxID=66852 RepID=UPI0025D909D1|nr:hypothetical protein [Methanobrevibacter sp.]MBQ2831593.1 hypothetical protein [Methanobrevibacter sp.]
MKNENELIRFQRSMEPSKEIFTQEIRKFAKKFDFLGEMTIIEEPDISTMDYIYSFKTLNGTSRDKLDSTLLEIYNHMEKFSKENGIDEFCSNTIIWI